MRLFIPDVGTSIELTKDWTFSLILEMRNLKAAELLGVIPKQERTPWSRDYLDRRSWKYKEATVTLQKGIALKIDRVYIRKGKAAEFNSLSFYITNGKKKARFFARLKDVNRIECDIL